MKQKSNITVDFHAHILPECDHGSDSVDVSVKQLKMAAEAGIKVICATPHFYPDRCNVKEFLSHRKHCFNKLKDVKIQNCPEIRPGAEVLVCENMDRMKDLELLCIKGTNYLLLEMPFYSWSDDLLDTVERLADRDDIRIVIAHADRYKPEDVECLIGMGLKLQLNADSLCSPFKSKKHLLKWIEQGHVMALGSDIHGTKTGYKHFIKCCTKYSEKLNCCKKIKGLSK